MFKPGDTVVFDPDSFNPEWWNALSEKERLRYYGCLGYGRDKPLLFTFICEYHPQIGHCVLINMENQKIETMCHISDFRLAIENEC
jgi:hypothetical protein